MRWQRKLGFPIFVPRGLLSCIVRLQTRVTPSCSLQTGKNQSCQRFEHQLQNTGLSVSPRWRQTISSRCQREDSRCLRDRCFSRFSNCTKIILWFLESISISLMSVSWVEYKRWNQCWEHLRQSCWTDNRRWTRLRLSGDRNLFMVSKLELKRWLLLTKIHSRVRGLFPGREPFWAGYGNKAWDILAYKVLTVFCSCLCVTVVAYFVFVFVFLQAIGINPNRIFNVLSDSKVIHFCLKLWMWPNL